MDFRFTPEDEALRAEALEFTRKEWDPKGYGDGAGIYYALSWDHHDPGLGALVKDFEKKLVKKGWWTMHWPTEHGGQGVNITTQMAYREAMSYAGAPATFGGGLVAPVLMIQGADWMKEQFLPQVANADLEFSQGFSEPDAGSDLAGLKTRAVKDGDDYVINGQKIWGTYRDPWIHLLVRTDPEAPKHRGITYLLAPLVDEQGNYPPGVSVRGIPDALGRHRWDELFMEDWRVPAQNIIGEENRGWYAAMTTLSFERSNIEGPAMLIRIIEEFVEHSQHLGRTSGSGPLDRAVVRNQLANLRLEVETMRMLSYRVGWMQTKGEIPVMEASMTKFWADELTQRVYRFISRSLGDYGNLLPGNRIRLPMNGFVNSNAVNTTGISIAGGTTEVQKNIIAQRGLGLPR